MKTYKEILEGKKLNASAIVKMIKTNEEDWGDLGDQVKVVKGNLEVIDSFFYGADKAMKQLINGWTTSNGDYASHFKKEYGISFKLIDKFEMLKATGRYKKLTTDGIVGIILKVQ